MCSSVLQLPFIECLLSQGLCYTLEIQWLGLALLLLSGLKFDSQQVVHGMAGVGGVGGVEGTRFELAQVRKENL